MPAFGSPPTHNCPSASGPNADVGRQRSERREGPAWLTFVQTAANDCFPPFVTVTYRPTEVRKARFVVIPLVRAE